MLLMLLLIPLQWPMIIMCPLRYLLSNVPPYGGTVTVNALIKRNCELGVRLIGQPIMTLCLLLNGLRLSPIIFIKDHFVPSCFQDLQITCGGILPRTSVEYPKFIIDPPLMLTVLLLILLANYHCLLILIPVCPLFHKSLMRPTKSLGG